MIRPADYGFRTIRTGNRTHKPATSEMCADAKAYGLAHGYKGDVGGWIYDSKGQHIAHGWGQFYYSIGGMTIENWKHRNTAAPEREPSGKGER